MDRSFIFLDSALALILVVSIISYGYSLGQAFATSVVSWDGGGDGVRWSDCTNWTDDTCPENATAAFIPSGNSVLIDTDVDMNGVHFEMNPGANLTIGSGHTLSHTNDNFYITGTLNIEPAGAFHTNTFVTENGTINNYGTIVLCGGGGSLGPFNNNPGSKFIIQCQSEFQNAGIINNSGLIENEHGSTFRNHVIYNNGSFVNNGAFKNYVVENGGIFNNTGTIDNRSGRFTNLCGSEFFNTGIVQGDPVENLTCGPFVLNLFQSDGTPAGGVVPIEAAIQAIAESDDQSVTEIKFRWIEPNGQVARTHVVTSSDGSLPSAEDSLVLNEQGPWIVEADFGNGQVVQETLDVSFFVVPESPIGAIAMIGGSMSALGLYLYFKMPRKPLA